jgi:putative ABC transport system substrate-binding protein
MRRRQFITLLGGAATWPLAARAQQPDRMRRLGVLMTGAATDPIEQAQAKAIQQGLEKLGWQNGRNVRIDIRWGGGDTERFRVYAADLVELRPDVILTGSNQVTTILSRQTSTIPIVFAGASDPLETGLVTNMARPGGNVTGFLQLEVSIAGKWLELLKEAAPHLTRIAVLYNRDGPAQPGYLRNIDAAVPSFGLRTVSVPANDLAEMERVIGAFSREANGGLIALSNPQIIVYREQIIALAARQGLPAIYPYRYFATDGGLMSYGPDLIEQYLRAMSYVDRILKGEKPGDLPVQAPTKYELVINLKTAKAINLTMPESLLVRADEVIE